MNSSLPDDARRSRRTDYAVVMAGFLVQMLVQVIFQQLLALRFGSASTMDAYVNALTLPLSLSAVIAGALGPIVITLLGNRSGEDEAFSFVTFLLGMALVGCVVLALIGVAFASSVIRLLYPLLDVEQHEETVGLFRVLVWLLPLNVAIGLLQAILNSSLNFTVPAFAGGLGPLVTVLFVWWFRSHQTLVVAWGTVIGAMVNVVIQLAWGVSTLRWKNGYSTRHMRTAVALGGPILMGMFILKVDPNVDRHVLSLLQDPGVTARQNWASQLTLSFLMVASGALSTVTFPRIAAKSVQGPEELGREVCEGLGMLILLCLPAVTAILVFGDVIVRDLLERGEFLPEDTQAVARIMKWYSPWIIGAALGELSSKTLISLKDSVTPNLIGGVFLCAGFVLKFSYVKTGGVEVLAAITSLVSLSAGLSQLLFVARRVGSRRLLPALRSVFTGGIGTLAAVVTGWGVLQTSLPYSGLGGLAAGGCVYFVVLGILGAPGAVQLIERIVPKTKNWKNPRRG